MKTSMPSGAVVAVATVLGLAGVAQAATKWDGGGDGTTWDSGNNWDPDGVPSGGDEVQIDNGAQITSSGTHSIGTLRVGYGTLNGLVKVAQTAGTVSANQVSISECGTYELQGGSFTQTGSGSWDGIFLGFDGGGNGTAYNGTFIVSGGALTVQGYLSMIQGNDAHGGELSVVGGLGSIQINGALTQQDTPNGPGYIDLKPDGNDLSAINVGGSVTLSKIVLSVSFTNANPTTGSLLTVINKTSSGAISGTLKDSTGLTNLVEGMTFTVPGIRGRGFIKMEISYNDFLSGSRGDNDLVLKVLTAPGGTLILVR